MSEMASPPAPDAQAASSRGDSDEESWRSLAWFIAKVVAAVLVFRIFLFAPFTIPSESMLPQLQNGDYLVAAKWPYGYSKLSMPFEAPLIQGRIFADLPERGDIAIFKHPVDGTDYIKRVIGLPGDSVAMRGGRVILNGRELPQTDRGVFFMPVSQNTGCAWGGQEVRRAEAVICEYRAATETLPSGRRYRVLDFGSTRQDDTAPVIVPRGQLFVMGDNRDNSEDSRYWGFLPERNLRGKAFLIWMHIDGGVDFSRIGDSIR